MKPITAFTLTALLVSIFTLTHAKTVRVNADLETDAANGVFATLQLAHNDASVQNGDTLLVEGAVNTYGNLICTKRLVIIGPGYHLLENSPTHVNQLPARVDRIDFNAGSEGSTLIGLLFSITSSFNEVRIRVNDISIIRCYLTYGITISASGISSLLVMQSYVRNVGISSSFHTLSGVVLKNNIIGGSQSVSSSADSPRIFAQVENNIFLRDVTMTVQSFRNNIINNRNATVNITSNVIQNNLSAQLSGIATNIDFDPNTLFVGLQDAGGSPDGQYRLKSNSPYLTAGYEGTEVGIFGGNDPYMLSGISGIPTIYDLHAESTTTRESGLRVSIKAKTNP